MIGRKKHTITITHLRVLNKENSVFFLARVIFLSMSSTTLANVSVRARTATREHMIATGLLPVLGWSDAEILGMVEWARDLDSNTFPGKASFSFSFVYWY